MDLPVTNTKVQDITLSYNSAEQQNEIKWDKVVAIFIAVTQDTGSDSGSDWEFLNAWDSSGVKCDIKVSAENSYC